MINGKDLERLIELAFDSVAAETEQQANQLRDQAALSATETTTFAMWLDLVDCIKAWNCSNENKNPMTWIGALQFFSTRQAELKRSQIRNLSVE